MPTSRRSSPAPADFLSGSRGGFDVTSDPRVQQALITDALSELDYDPTRAPRWTQDDLAETRKTRDFGRGLDEDRQTARFEDEMAETYEPRQMGRKLNLARTFGPDMARVQAQIGDIGSEAEARRETLPYRAGVRQQEYDQKYRMATDPARLAGEARIEEAKAKARAAVDAALARKPDGAAALLNAVASATRSGLFTDDEGGSFAPDQDVVNEIVQYLRSRISGNGTNPGGNQVPSVPSGPPARGGGAGPATGGAQFSPEIEQLIQEGISAGLARDRNEAIAALRQRGLIPR